MFEHSPKTPEINKVLEKIALKQLEETLQEIEETRAAPCIKCAVGFNSCADFGAKWDKNKEIYIPTRKCIFCMFLCHNYPKEVSEELKYKKPPAELLSPYDEQQLRYERNDPNEV